MGYFLLYEAMLKTVLYARDKWLKPNGLLLPSLARMYIGLYCDDEYVNSKIDFWKNVYGVDMSPMIPMAKQYAFYPSTAVDTIKGEALISESVLVKSLDCVNVLEDQLETFRAPFNFRVFRTCNWQGFVGWFDVEFPGKGQTPTSGPIVLSTAPGLPYTHWHQTLFVFNEPISVKKNDTITGNITIQHHPQAPRHLTIIIEFMHNGNSYTRLFDF
eukprot:TRINITY_DN208_c0_g1_i3.p1 TRINITY_DN208_c0_g1~~TRINITY_DN208_c0_g1_i3.p1  ORF type:complete len:215 (+),score=36.42 TRINITY_DN208_c0_g1_i3:622-1266(+)